MGSPGVADVGVIQVPDDQAAVWLRRVVQLPGPQDASVSMLQIRGRGRVNVYVNGQRLARNAELTEGHILQFDVTGLIRAGANGFALSAHRSDSGIPLNVSAWFQYNGQQDAMVTNGDWKQRDSVPPVGWERTDFNPHGWKEVQPAAEFALSAIADDQLQLTEWRRPVVESGFGTSLKLRDGDHVVLLGGTFIERAQLYGHLEAMLSLSIGDAAVTFRNLGWSGDTVFAESRGIFDTPQQGFLRLIEHIRAEEPTVILICYGQNEAMADAGREAVNRFGRQLQKLHNDLQSTGAQIVLVSPHPLLFARPPIPSPNRFNPAIEEYAVEIQRIAQEMDVPFVDLFSDFPGGLANAQTIVQPDVPFSGDLLAESEAWTDNGMHWNESGYQRIGILFAERCLAQQIQTPSIRIQRNRQSIEVQGGEVRETRWNADGSVEFEFRASRLTPLPYVIEIDSRNVEDDLRHVAVSSSSGSVPRLIAPSGDGAALRFVGTRCPQYEQLRTLITKKNELYFHRWRPQNITYLYGFRKHEQGNNAAEIAMFDPLVDELEQQIHALQEPQWETLRVNP